MNFRRGREGGQRLVSAEMAASGITGEPSGTAPAVPGERTVHCLVSSELGPGRACY